MGRACCRALVRSTMRIFKQRNCLRACASARVVCGAGYAVRLIFPALPGRGERSVEKRGGVRSLLSGRRAARQALSRHVLSVCVTERRLSALTRDDFSPRDRASGCPTGACGSLHPAGFRPPSSAPRPAIQGRPLVVGPDGYPGPPGGGITSPARRGAASRSDFGVSPEDAPR